MWLLAGRRQSMVSPAASMACRSATIFPYRRSKLSSSPVSALQAPKSAGSPFCMAMSKMEAELVSSWNQPMDSIHHAMFQRVANYVQLEHVQRVLRILCQAASSLSRALMPAGCKRAILRRTNCYVGILCSLHRLTMRKGHAVHDQHRVNIVQGQCGQMKTDHAFVAALNKWRRTLL